MIQAAQPIQPYILQFPTRLQRLSGNAVRPGTSTSLRDYYQSVLLHDLRDLSRRSLESDRNALSNWERFTSNPCILSSSVDELCDAVRELRDGLLIQGRSPATINKNWRELKAMFEAACADGFCSAVPMIRERRRGRVVKGKLAVEPPKAQRECITAEECNRLYQACEHATYPALPRSVERWRVLLYLFWCYGARTHDFIRHLRREHVLESDRLLRFTASKTSKLQGLPLTDLGLSLLKSILPSSGSARIFPGFNSKGCQLASGRWKSGYYTAWRRDIVPQAGIHTRITFKHFRERVVTKYNALHSGLGHWIAGHSVGALAAAYDLPTDQIRAVIDSADVPSCFTT